jgi:tRNA-specific 2-thiouridylase
MHVLAAMSGGVDSSVAAALLVEAGHSVTGVFLRNGVTAGPRAASGKQGCCSVGDAADAARVADLLGIPFYSLDFSAGFDRIVADFARAYAEGRTPNPCVACNRDLKFGLLMRYADAIGADAVATGHYAAVEPRDGRMALRIPADRAKDQTYVLFPLGQEELRRTMFPLAAMTKSETRAYAARRGLPVAEKPESMEICFVPDGDYRAIVAARAPGAVVPGDVVDASTSRATSSSSAARTTCCVVRCWSTDGTPSRRRCRRRAARSAAWRKSGATTRRRARRCARILSAVRRRCASCSTNP